MKGRLAFIFSNSDVHDFMAQFVSVSLAFVRTWIMLIGSCIV